MTRVGRWSEPVEQMLEAQSAGLAKAWTKCAAPAADLQSSGVRSVHGEGHCVLAEGGGRDQTDLFAAIRRCPDVRLARGRVH